VTLFGIFLTPVFFYAVQWFGGGRPAAARPTTERETEAAHVSS
jgi:hypothetical protein